jgi:hypothetical protein
VLRQAQLLDKFFSCWRRGDVMVVFGPIPGVVTSALVRGVDSCTARTIIHRPSRTHYLLFYISFSATSVTKSDASHLLKMSAIRRVGEAIISRL